MWVQKTVCHAHKTKPQYNRFCSPRIHQEVANDQCFNSQQFTNSLNSPGTGKRW